ncbi:O-antigen ligase family protein [Marinobacter lipolyticus]|uniref:O-antigen ligase family protein n=1 Tax=Marinobacter lipolyticus TaxID=209639 RepID=UPI003A9148B0
MSRFILRQNWQAKTAGSFDTQRWISAFLLLFLTFSMLVPWIAFYRAFLFVGVFPLILWACVRREAQVGIDDRTGWLAVGLIGFVTAATFVPSGLVPDEQYQIVRWAVSTAVFVLAVLAASQLWLSKPRFYARIMVGVVIVSGVLAVVHYLWAGQYPARISGFGFLSHPILGPSSLISWWAIAMVMYRMDCRRSVYDHAVIVLSFLVVFTIVMLSQSRGPFVALSVFMFTFLLSLMWVSERKDKWIYIIGLVGGCVLLGVLSALLFDDLINRMIERGLSYRPQIWLAVLQNPPELIWFGAGMASDFTTSEAGKVLYEQIGIRIKHPHNLFIGAFHYSGLVGAGIFFILLTWGLVRILRLSGLSGRRIRPFAIGLYILTLLLNMTDGYRLVAPPSPDWLFFWLPFMFLVGLAKFFETHEAKGHAL